MFYSSLVWTCDKQAEFIRACPKSCWSKHRFHGQFHPQSPNWQYCPSRPSEMSSLNSSYYSILIDFDQHDCLAHLCQLPQLNPIIKVERAYSLRRFLPPNTVIALTPTTPRRRTWQIWGKCCQWTMPNNSEESSVKFSLKTTQWKAASLARRRKVCPIILQCCQTCIKYALYQVKFALKITG